MSLCEALARLISSNGGESLCKGGYAIDARSVSYVTSATIKQQLCFAAFSATELHDGYAADRSRSFSEEALAIGALKAQSKRVGDSKGKVAGTIIIFV